MKTIHSMIAALGLAFVLPAAADAATTDPEVIIYRFPAVADDVAAGVATAFQCTNFSGAMETIRFVTRHSNGLLLTNFSSFVNHLASLTAATHFAGVLGVQLNLGTGAVCGGTTAIAATSTNIVCTAMTIVDSNPKPDGLVLRGI